MITTQRAQEFGIKAQLENETDSQFRSRVAEAIRAMGYPIEAHEAFTDKLYDDNNELGMLGIMGFTAQVMQRKQYPGSQIANDIAAGVVAREPERSPVEVMLMLALAMMR